MNNLIYGAGAPGESLTFKLSRGQNRFVLLAREESEGKAQLEQQGVWVKNAYSGLEEKREATVCGTIHAGFFLKH